MKKLLLSTAILALTAGAALAADLPSRKAEPLLPPPPPPPPMWTGFYAGLNAGYGFGTNTQTNSAFYQYGSLNHWDGTDSIVGGALGANTFAMTQSGFIGGGQVGYNYQWGSNIVIGLEADIQGSGIRGRSNSVGIAGAGGAYGPYGELGAPYGNYSQSGPAGQTINAGVDWMGTVRGRLGYLWTPTMLVYATGGLTYGGVYANVAATSQQNGAAASGRTDLNGNPINYITNQTFVGGGQRSATLVGWNVGGGLEWMFMPSWSLKAEAIYWNMGNQNVGTAAFASGANFGSSDGLNHYAAGYYSLNPAQIVGGSRVNYQGVIARMGINYHFNWAAAAPIVAKY
jgi:outer membrane immunogenic protein